MLRCLFLLQHEQLSLQMPSKDTSGVTSYKVYNEDLNKVTIVLEIHDFQDARKGIGKQAIFSQGMFRTVTEILLLIWSSILIVA